jgi:hypothetical protein
MNTTSKHIFAAMMALSLSFAGSIAAQSDAPYTEGSVWTMSMVKTKTGMTDDYMKNLAHAFRPVMEEAKKQHTILSYKILLGDAANGQDFDVLLMLEYKNMAALDNLRDKMDPILKKVVGEQDARRQAQVKRGETREVLGTKTLREIRVK